jgi:signal transduction histidine kinase
VLERRRLALPAEAHLVRAELPTAPVLVSLGPQGCERLVTNLVDNAFLHGSPPVTVSVSHEDDHGVLRVGDTGPGMPEDLLRSATGRFTRAADARARPGAGLGLSLVERLVADAGGELRLCHGGRHASYGVPAGVSCTHGPEMTVTVLLPSS